MKLAQTQLELIPQSLVSHEGLEFGIARTPEGLRLAVLARGDEAVLKAFEGKLQTTSEGQVLLADLSAHNAAALRQRLPWLQPQPLGLATSAGMGDRLGLATPGHVRALKQVGGGIAPIFAQQSMREMARTVRTPQNVMDDATWGIFQEGWQGGIGADADHLKTTQDIDVCLAAGFTFFTIDPGDHVDNRAEGTDLAGLKTLAQALPEHMQGNASQLLETTIDLESKSIYFDEKTLLKAMVKYGRAIDHVANMYRHLIKTAGSKAVELEVSVDETEQPTSHAEHVYFASELKRLGVKWVSLAPRYVGRFEKGVDYIGDLVAFKADIEGHAVIARKFGPYKLSLHSGSDKFSIYPIAMKATKGLVHLKTAGTSYLEALHTVAMKDVDFLKEIYSFARERYETDRLTYHVSAQLSRAPLPEAVTNWPALLAQFDAREILHVTFGSVLREQREDGNLRFAERLFALLRAHPETYAGNLEQHFIKHLKPFSLKE